METGSIAASKNKLPRTKQPSVYICVLNYGRPVETIQCLEALKKLDYNQFTVVVIDNASPDDSVQQLQTYFDTLDPQALNVHFIASDDNNGYSAGNNKGIKYALAQEADYVWLLNNDTTMEPNALEHLVAEAEKTGGLVGSLLLYPDRSYQQVGTEMNWWTGKVQGIAETELKDGMRLESLSGASMLIPARVLRRVGLLDERYFLYFEDGDFCLRASEKRCPITLALRSRVYHQEGATTGKGSLMVQYYYQRNRLYLLSRFAGKFQFGMIWGYSVFRLWRTQFKALAGDEGRKESARVHWLAFMDFMGNKTGKAQHQF